MNRDPILEFDPVKFSHEENRWLLENLDKPVAVALSTIRAEQSPTPSRKDSNPTIYPDGVNPSAVRPLLERVQELEDLQKFNHQPWVGKAAIKAAIAVYLAEDAKWESANKRNKRVPRFPSLYSFDSKGRPHIAGPGSDSGQARTYFTKDGKRERFAIDLLASDEAEWLGPGFTEQGEPGLHEDTELNRFECRVEVTDPDGTKKICGHTESWKEGSRASRVAARARMSKHLRRSTVEPDGHRELYTLEFGGVNA